MSGQTDEAANALRRVINNLNSLTDILQRHANQVNLSDTMATSLTYTNAQLAEAGSTFLDKYLGPVAQLTNIAHEMQQIEVSIRQVVQSWNTTSTALQDDLFADIRRLSLR